MTDASKSESDNTKALASFGTSKERFKRYEKAKSRMDLWTDLLRNAYELTIPNRDDFEDESKGNDRFDDVFDSTAVMGVKDFSNNVQASVMPYGQHWATLVPGSKVKSSKEISDSEKTQFSEELQVQTEVLFEELNRSNYEQAINTSFKDFAVGTAILVINEGDDENPLEFVSVPISEMSFEQGSNGRLENFWRTYGLSLRVISQKWPDATLPNELQMTLKTAPEKIVKVIESCIRNPFNDPDEQYLYSIQIAEDQNHNDLVNEIRNYNPFTGFRFDVSPGEIMGRGIVLDLLPDIRVLNKMAELDLRGADWRANPSYFIESNATINPFMGNLESGSMIPIDPTLGNKDPIRPVEVGGDVNFQQLKVENLQTVIRTALFSDPLGDVEKTTNQTATQSQLRQQAFIKKSAAAFSRLTSELLTPILTKIIIILRKKGIINDVDISGENRLEITMGDRTVSVDYASPILDVQNQQDVQALNQYLQFIAGNFGSQGVMTSVKFEKIAPYSADKFGVDLALVNNEDEVAKAMQDAAQAAQDAQQAAQAQQEAQSPVKTQDPGASGLQNQTGSI